MNQTSKMTFYDLAQWRKIKKESVMMNVHEVSDFLGISKSTVYRLMEQDEQFPQGRLYGRNRRWSSKEIYAYARIESKKDQDNE